MSAQVQIPEDQLVPGDLVDVEYVIKAGASPTLVGLAIHEVKKSLWGDPRFVYQGYHEETRLDKSGLDGSVQEVRYAIVTVMVADPAKQTGNDTGMQQEQKAGVGLVTIVALVGLVSAAIVAYSGVIALQSYYVRRNTVDTLAAVDRVLANPNLSEAEKTAALTAIGKTVPAPVRQTGVGAGIAAAGGSLLTAAIIIGVLWALSLGRNRGSGE